MSYPEQDYLATRRGLLPRRRQDLESRLKIAEDAIRKFDQRKNSGVSGSVIRRRRRALVHKRNKIKEELDNCVAEIEGRLVPVVIGAGFNTPKVMLVPPGELKKV